MFHVHVVAPQISTSDRTHAQHARTGPDTPRAQTQNHTQNTNTRTHIRQTSLTPTHLAIGERCQQIRPTAPASHPPTLSHQRPRARARAPAWGTIACASSTDPSASASARRTPCRCCSSRTDLRHLQPTASKAPRGETGGRQEGPRRNSPLIRRKPSLSRFCNVCNDASTPSEGACAPSMHLRPDYAPPRTQGHPPFVARHQAR